MTNDNSDKSDKIPIRERTRKQIYIPWLPTKVTIVTITPIREKRNLYSPSFLKTPNTYLSGKGQMSVSVVTAQLSTVTTIKPFIIWEEWTALLSESICKGSYLSHIRLVLPYLIEIPSMPLQSKIGACSVSLSGLPISNRETTAQRNFAFTWYNQFPDFKSGYYRQGLSSNFRVGANQIPLCSFQKRKAAYIPPENRGYVCTGSNLLPENSGYCRHWCRCSARLHFKSNLKRTKFVV